jgi:hypothetical protein
MHLESHTNIDQTVAYIISMYLPSAYEPMTIRKLVRDVCSCSNQD